MNIYTDEKNKLGHELSCQYDEEGFLLIESFFDSDEIERLRYELEVYMTSSPIGCVYEEKTDIVRAIHGCHLYSDFFEKFVRLDRLLQIAKAILMNQIYLYQFKVNFKHAFSGDVWPWHQDYEFWSKEDGMKTPSALSMMIFLDDVREYNAPLMVIPGSHRQGLINEAGGDEVCRQNWESNLKSNLKYQVGNDVIENLVQKNGLVVPRGDSGSILLFHPNLVHGSGSNISPSMRRTVILTYNSVENAPRPEDIWRPAFLVGRDTSMLQELNAKDLY